MCANFGGGVRKVERTTGVSGSQLIAEKSETSLLIIGKQDRREMKCLKLQWII